jgi:hypothetical protein
VKPTIFANVRNDMSIAREEVFGPVLAILPYRDEAEAIRIANDTVYGLSGYVTSASIERARSVAAQLRTGMVHLNGAIHRHRRALRRLQAVGQRPRVGRTRLPRLPRDQGGDGVQPGLMPGRGLRASACPRGSAFMRTSHRGSGFSRTMSA